jgi:16S rRNA (uracil1498-N3)-methyltransferase
VHRFYLPSARSQAGELTLPGREAHHALHVVRIRPGDRLTVLDGVGHEFLCQARERRRDELSLEVLEKRDLPRRSWEITLLQAVPKGKLIETVIQKATELGAARIVPLLSERVVHQLDRQGIAQKTEKWQWVAIEAIKQCGTAWLPIVEPPVTLERFLSRKESFELPLVASLQNGSKHPRQHFLEFQTKMGRKPQSVCVWVGPEGDFTPKEIEAIERAGGLPITLGSLVLRSDTAAVYCLSVLNYELQAPAP